MKTKLTERTLRLINMSDICAEHTCDGINPCIICGKELKVKDTAAGYDMPTTKSTYWLHMTTTGYLTNDPECIIPEEGDEPHAVGQGWFQVGKACYDRFMIESKEVTKEELFETINH